MGFLDRAKEKAQELADRAGPKVNEGVGKAKETAGGLAAKHGDKVTGGLGKAKDFVDDKTKGKYTDKLDGAVDKVAKGIDRVERNKKE